MEKRVCVSIGAKTREQALEQALSAAADAQVVEIRLDLLDEPAVSPFIGKIPCEVLFTCRAQWEGGAFRGSEEERIDLLQAAAQSGSAYVDLELRSSESAWQELRRTTRDSATQLICSWHDFNITPARDDLHRIIAEMRRSGADIGKIVTMATDAGDVLRVLCLQEYARAMDFPLIAFCMGEAGRISRVATLALGGYMTYCAAEEDGGVAPGQMSLDVMQKVTEMLGI